MIHFSQQSASPSKKISKPLKTVFQLKNQNPFNFSIAKMKKPHSTLDLDQFSSNQSLKSNQPQQYIIKINRRVIWTGLAKTEEINFTQIHNYEKQIRIFSRSEKQDRLKSKSVPVINKYERKPSILIGPDGLKIHQSKLKTKCKANSLGVFSSTGFFTVGVSQINPQWLRCRPNVLIPDYQKKQNKQNLIPILKRNTYPTSSVDKLKKIFLPKSENDIVAYQIKGERKLLLLDYKRGQESKISKEMRLCVL